MKKEVKEIKETNSKKLKGTVVSDKMDKTVVVSVERYVKHPKYKKYFNISKRIKAHDEKNECKEGDVVIIEECRPISKDKSFKILSIEKK
ncbi:MAG: 30S ribosomal protein S17 [bacterium]